MNFGKPGAAAFLYEANWNGRRVALWLFSSVERRLTEPVDKCFRLKLLMRFLDLVGAKLAVDLGSIYSSVIDQSFMTEQTAVQAPFPAHPSNNAFLLKKSP